MNVNPGKLIVIEGLEGAGKSTAIAAVVEWLAKQSIELITTREPGGTEIGEQLRSIIKNSDYKDTLTDKCELLLLYAARIQLVEEVIKPALARGVWVIADRFELSTIAYQGGGRGLSQQMIATLSEFCLNGFQADLTLYLDLKPELGMQRAQQRGQFDRIEQQEMDFFHRVHKAYLESVKNKANTVLINASKSLFEVQEDIRIALSRFIEQ